MGSSTPEKKTLVDAPHRPKLSEPIRRAEAKGVVMDGDVPVPGDRSEENQTGEELGEPAPPPPVDLSTGPEMPATPPPPSSNLLKRALIALGAFVVVGGIAAMAIVFVALRGTGDVIDQMVPGDSTAYVTIYLDPALKQKLNLRGLVKKFPDLADSAALDRRINELLDQALNDAGLTAQDIRPWLGSQIAFVVQLDANKPHVAVLVASKDDGKAQAALTKIRTGEEGSQDTWKDEDHGGVSVSVASKRGEPDGAYAIIEHTVLIGDVEAVEAVIDTSQGKTSSIQDSDRFAKAVSSLPEERLALAYVDFGPLIGKLQQALTEEGGFDLSQLSSSFGQLDAITGMGATLSAHPDGIALDLAVGFDRSKLSAEQQQIMAEAPQQSSVLAFTPRNTYGLLAATGFRQTVKGYIDEFKRADPGGFAQLDAEVGLSRVVDDLSGDFGMEVSPGGPGRVPAGALLIGTSNEAGMRTFLENIADLAADGLGDEFSTLKLVHETYRGVDIAYLSSADLSAYGVTPAYAVTKGTAIVGSSLVEMKAIIDAQADGSNVTSAPNLVAATDPGDLSNNGMLYLDLEAIVRDIRATIGLDALAEFDASGGKNLAPLRALVLITRGDQDLVSLRMFLLVR
jgi:hypothetical protein